MRIGRMNRMVVAALACAGAGCGVAGPDPEVVFAQASALTADQLPTYFQRRP